MIGVLFCAGMGQRLGPLGRRTPKVLMSLGGRTLLERHCDAFTSCGIERMLVVVGYHADELREAIDRIENPIAIETAINERYRRGLILTMNTALRALPDGEDLLLMDADTLYPKKLMARLVDSPHRTCVLLDPTSEHVNEEMMLGVRDGRVLQFRRGLDDLPWEVTGETVGWLKIAADDVPLLREKVGEVIETLGVDSEYEEAYELLAAERPIGWERVDDLPWMEIDFPDDLAHAERDTLPRVLEMDGAWSAVRP